MSASLLSVPLLAALVAAPAFAVMPVVPSRFVTSDGVKVHYKAFGPDGKTALVFVHGWTCDLTFWDAQVPAFAPLIRTIVLDLPGHGKSEAPEVDYTMDLFARAVVAVMKDAGVEKAVLVGHSMGTPVARQAYRLFPAKVAALVAVDGTLRTYFTDPEKKKAYLSRYEGPGGIEVRRKGAESMLSAATPKEDRERIVKTMVGTPAHVALSAQRGMLDDAVWKDDPIDVPLLLVMARSPFWGDDYFRYVRTLCPAADAVLVDGAGHFVMVDEPELVNGVLRGFLARLGLLPF